MIVRIYAGILLQSDDSVLLSPYFILKITGRIVFQQFFNPQDETVSL